MKPLMLVAAVGAGIVLLAHTLALPVSAQDGTPPAAGGSAVPPPTPPLFKGERKDPNAKERTLVGIVTDAMENPIGGAVVQIKDTKSLRVRSFLTKADGKYQFHGLSLDIDYEVKAERSGKASNPRTLSVYDTRKEPILNLKIE